MPENSAFVCDKSVVYGVTMKETLYYCSGPFIFSADSRFVLKYCVVP
jgi:hypothetical protein